MGLQGDVPVPSRPLWWASGGWRAGRVRGHDPEPGRDSDREQPSQEFVRADSTPVLVELSNGRQRREGLEANDVEL